jgi:hypothetical protein
LRDRGQCPEKIHGVIFLSSAAKPCEDDMRYRCPLALALVLLALGQVPVFATDLTKIDRSIAKEPAYKNKPKYCLLVFGPEAKQRVWLVQDGAVLYVDRNGNGDLTEAGNKIAAEKNEGAEGGAFAFKLPELRVGARLHKNLNVYIFNLDQFAERDARAKEFVAKNPAARAYMVRIDVEMPGWKGTGIGGRVQQSGFYVDVNGVLQFADHAKDAPILHFGGPLQVTLFGRHELKIGRESDVVLGVGSPGVGPGTHTFIDYEGVIPEKAYPTLEIVYPAKKSGEPPIRQRYELKERC